MAALVATGDEALGLQDSGKLLLTFDGQAVKDRKSRVEHLRERAGVPVAETKLESVVPRPKKRLADEMREAELILLTSQEIDFLCEGDNVHLARQTMDNMLNELRRTVRQLAEVGVEHVVIAADHGYLFGEELGVEMKIDPPGGEQVGLHRRIWIGRGGAADPAYLRARLADFGYDTDLEIAAPWGFGCFKVRGGARAYFHGGLSPQELVIPVVTVRLTPKKQETKGQIEWTPALGSGKITSRFFSVRIQGRSVGLFPGDAPRVRLEVAVKGKPAANAVSASYGFDEGSQDVQLRWSEDNPNSIEDNTVTMMILEPKALGKSVTIRLLDADTAVELASFKADVEIKI